MTDRELLELAAKAAGYKWRWYCAPVGQLFQIKRRETWEFWSPITDDGDALRLAVKLRINTQHDDESPVVLAYYMLPGRFSANRECEEYGDDPAAATRRAIVKAAAEIGRR